MWSVINVANNKFKKFYITGPDYRYIVSTSEKDVCVGNPLSLWLTHCI